MTVFRPKRPGFTPKPRGFRGSLDFAYRSDGSVIARKAPRKRPKISPITEQQVATWDDALQIIKLADHQQVQAAYDLSNGTGFFARDILIAGAYGHMTSWPGWGVMPNGSAGPFPYLTQKKLPSFPPRPLGFPQPINIAYNIKVDASEDAVTLDCQTAHDASPLLLKFCCEPIRVPVGTKRRGEEQPHGNKLFFPCDPTTYTPSSDRGKVHHWDLPVDDFDPPCDNCSLVIVEEGSQPVLNFDSLPIPCPSVSPPPPVDAYYLGTYVGGQADPTGPGFPAFWDFLVSTDADNWDIISQCFESLGNIIIDQHVVLQDFGDAAGQVTTDGLANVSAPQCDSVPPPFGYHWHTSPIYPGNPWRADHQPVMSALNNGTPGIHTWVSYVVFHVQP